MNMAEFRGVAELIYPCGDIKKRRWLKSENNPKLFLLCTTKWILNECGWQHWGHGNIQTLSLGHWTWIYKKQKMDQWEEITKTLAWVTENGFESADCNSRHWTNNGIDFGNSWHCSSVDWLNPVNLDLNVLYLILGWVSCRQSLWYH